MSRLDGSNVVAPLEITSPRLVTVTLVVSRTKIRSLGRAANGTCLHRRTSIDECRPTLAKVAVPLKKQPKNSMAIGDLENGQEFSPTPKRGAFLLIDLKRLQIAIHDENGSTTARVFGGKSGAVRLGNQWMIA